MRSGVIITGAFLLVIGVLLVGVGAGLKTAAEECNRVRCADADDAVVFAAVGTGMLYPGGLLGVAGIGLIVAGILADAPAKPKTIPVNGGPTSIQRPCPACDKPLVANAKYCASCGAAVAPLMSR